MALRTLKVKSLVVGSTVQGFIWTHPAKSQFTAEVVSNSIAGRKMKDATDTDTVVVRNVDTDELLTLNFAGGGAHIVRRTAISEAEGDYVEEVLRVTFKVEVPDAPAAVEGAVAAPEEPGQHTEEVVAS